MKELFRIMEQRLAAGESLALVTILSSSGATPRGAGARMLVGREGRLCGTIGGGAVEYRSEQLAMALLQEGGSNEQEFSLNPSDVQSLGMVCGGAVRVHFHGVPAADPETLAVVREALRRFQAGEAFWLCSDLERGGALSVCSKTEAPPWLSPHLGRKPALVLDGGRRVFAEQIGASGRVYIFGGGHVARELQPVLTHLGFRCVVMDDRPEFADRCLFPTAEEVLCVDFERIEDAVSIGPQDYVCVMTRGHASDAVVEAQVLNRQPRYNGMIGSRYKAAAVRRALQEEYGFPEETVDQIISPIGLAIKAQTPAEIAISIAAQMITARAET